MLWFMARTDANLSRPFWKGLSMCVSLILHETLLPRLKCPLVQEMNALFHCVSLINGSSELAHFRKLHMCS